MNLAIATQEEWDTPNPRLWRLRSLRGLSAHADCP